MSIHVTFSFCFLEAMPQRLCPDPTVGVRDLQQPISNWLKESGSYDLFKLLQPKNAVSWKTAADCEWLCQLSPLLLKLIRVDGKCCFASKKIKGALQKIQTCVHRINFSKHNDDTFYDMCDLWIRQACSQVRSLKQQPCQMTRCLKKASIQEAATLEEMVGMVDNLVLEADGPGASKEEKAEKDQKQEKGQKQETTCLEIVPFQKGDATNISPQKIFTRILARKSSEEGSAPAPHSSNPTAASSGQQPLQQPKTYRRQNADVNLGKHEHAWLAEALAVSLEERIHCCISVFKCFNPFPSPLVGDNTKKGEEKEEEAESGE